MVARPGFSPRGRGVSLHLERKLYGEMLIKGELDASLHHPAGGNLVDRSSVDIWRDGRFRLLFPDRPREGIGYYRKTGYYPINHGFVVKREVYEEHSWVVLNLFNVFSKARDVWMQTVNEDIAPFLATGILAQQARGDVVNPFVYGVRANEKILSAIATFSYEQGLTNRVVGLDEVFAPQTLEL
jgi:4,5-dihydroxyphthalate decarboxylase